MAEAALSRRNLSDTEIQKDAEAQLRRAEMGGGRRRPGPVGAGLGASGPGGDRRRRGAVRGPRGLHPVELTLDRDAALTAMGKAHGVVLRTTTIPILQHVLLRAGDDRLVIQACDQVMEAVSQASAEVAAAGAITVPAARLYDMLRALPAGGQLAVKLSAAPARLEVKCGRSRFQLQTLPVADFPKFDTATATHRASLPAKALAAMIDRVAFCQSHEQTRYYFCGVYLHIVEADGAAWLRAVATDGSRLGYHQIPAPEGWASAPGVILPSKTVGEARRLLEGVASDVEMWTDGRLWGLSAGDATLASKVVDGTFPDYTRVIPKAPPVALTLDVGDLSAALKRCGIMAGDKSRIVRLELAEAGLTLLARDGSGGEAEEPLEVDYEGPTRTLSFNAGFLLEIAAQMSGESLSLSLGGDNDPALVTDPLDAAAAYVCMPLRA
jgi:DNA polymerase-3 subunit beta